MVFILETQVVGGLSFSIWETGSGQFVALVVDPDRRWQSEPVESVAEAERLAREEITRELLTISQTIARMTAEAFAV